MMRMMTRMKLLYVLAGISWLISMNSWFLSYNGSRMMVMTDIEQQQAAVSNVQGVKFGYTIDSNTIKDGSLVDNNGGDDEHITAAAVTPTTTLQAKQDQKQGKRLQPKHWEMKQQQQQQQQHKQQRAKEEKKLLDAGDEQKHNNTQNSINWDDSFGACLKLMDDNHWLVEWLAYHYYVMPLRHLTVYIDPKSETDPQPIFDRWKGYMTIKVMNKTYPYADNNINGRGSSNISDTSTTSKNGTDDGEIDVANYRKTQIVFMKDCMKMYKERNTSWIFLIDTDEFIAVNHLVKNKKKEMDPTKDSDIYRPNAPSIDEPGSVMTFLKSELAHEHDAEMSNNTATDDSNSSSHLLSTSPNCIPMYRLQMCQEEEEKGGGSAIPSEVSSSTGSPLSWKPSDFLTHNFVWGEDIRRLKTMINIGAIPAHVFTDLLRKNQRTKSGHIHRPVPSECPKRFARAHPNSPGLHVDREKSFFQVYHYPGTMKQQSFRHDARGKFGARLGTQPATKCWYRPAGDLKPWLQGFINQVGQDEAERLLEGVGRVHSWPKYHATRVAAATTNTA